MKKSPSTTETIFALVFIAMLMILTSFTAIRNNTLESENYNLRQQLGESRFELQMITETNNIATFTK